MLVTVMAVGMTVMRMGVAVNGSSLGGRSERSSRRAIVLAIAIDVVV
jgi:hypothetical protein